MLKVTHDSLETQDIESKRKKDIENTLLYSLGLPVGIIAGYHNATPDNAHSFYSIMFALSIYCLGKMTERLSMTVYSGKHRS